MPTQSNAITGWLSEAESSDAHEVVEKTLRAFFASGEPVELCYVKSLVPDQACTRVTRRSLPSGKEALLMETTTPVPKTMIDQPDSHHFDAPYHCCEEWHLARLTPVCVPLYFFARRISYQSKIFVCSAVNLAGFLGYNERTIRRGLHQLDEIGFFELEEQHMFCPTKYRVFDHQEWAEQHPGRCAIKVEYPWAGEGDRLGQRLWVESGSRIKFAEFQVCNIRKLGLGEGEVLQEFKTYMEGAGRFKKPKNVPGGFYLYLRNR